MDKRHIKRTQLLQKLFAMGFEGTTHDGELDKLYTELPRIDERIAKHATRYPLDKIAKVDLAVLRLAVFELFFEKQNPPKVIVDEAVTLAREYGNEKSYSFVNGVLGSLLKDLEN